jgi:hypothetical protein
LIAGYVIISNTDINILVKGVVGGVARCADALPEIMPVFAFFYTDEGTPTMQKGRASMHKNGESTLVK